jgi:hypothetical protein
LLSNAADEPDYLKARKAVQELGVEPDYIFTNGPESESGL